MACDDKALCGEIMQLEGVAHIPHTLVSWRLDWHNFASGDREARVWQQCVKALAEAPDEGLVLKLNKGGDGKNMFRVRNVSELDHALSHMPKVDDDLSVSPFINIEEEYRVMVVAGNVSLVYRKRRPTVVGDGHSTATQLTNDFLARAVVPPSPRSVERALSSLRGGGDCVLAEGEEVLLEWQHNLCCGAEPQLLSLSDSLVTEALEPLAAKVVAALGLSYCAVDIVYARGGSSPVGTAALLANLKVMEVNKAPGLKWVVHHHPDLEPVVQSFVDKTVADAFGRNCSSLVQSHYVTYLPALATAASPRAIDMGKGKPQRTALPFVLCLVGGIALLAALCDRSAVAI